MKGGKFVFERLKLAGKILTSSEPEKVMINTQSEYVGKEIDASQVPAYLKRTLEESEKQKNDDSNGRR